MNQELMTLDSYLYAEIAREMAINNNYWELNYRNNDWLDKPHLLFWLSALSMELFGINHFAYRLPSILMFLVGLRYVWLLANYDYAKKTAYIAVIITAISQHLISSTSDLRTDTLLLGFIVMAVYYCRVLISDNKPRYILLGAMALSAALMTKGIFVLLVPCGGVLAYLLYIGKWQHIFNFRWCLLAILCLIFILPMLTAYYFQFDAQPHKQLKMQDWGTVSGVSAIKFYFWDSQIGRVFNTGLVKGTGTKWFYLITILWAFLPWGWLCYVSLFEQFKKILHRKDPAIFYLGCGLPLFVVYSLSSFQLPHYINILYPFFSIWIAHFLCSKDGLKVSSILVKIQELQFIIILPFLVYIFIIFNPSLSISMLDNLAVWLVGFVLIFLLLKEKSQNIKKLIYASAIMMIMINYSINRILLPQLLEYQCGPQIAHYIKNNRLDDLPIYINEEILGVDFYVNDVIPPLPDIDNISANKFYLITMNTQKLLNYGYSYETLFTAPHYSISVPTMEFWQHNSRSTVTSNCYLALLTKI